MTSKSRCANAASMSAPSATSRTVAKASGIYKNVEWDLVDAVENGTELEELQAEALPEPMREMSQEQRREFVEVKAERRSVLKQQIAQLGQDRRDYIAEEKAKQVGTSTVGLDDALKDGIRKVAEEQGLAFETAP